MRLILRGLSIVFPVFMIAAGLLLVHLPHRWHEMMLWAAVTYAATATLLVTFPPYRRRPLPLRRQRAARGRRSPGPRNYHQQSRAQQLMSRTPTPVCVAGLQNCEPRTRSCAHAGSAWPLSSPR
jgi:hypothetical protein